MLRDPSPDVDTIHPGELETFTTELIGAGFLPQRGDRHSWTGPIHPAFAGMTAATEMVLNIRDGWPYRHPYLFVEGLVGRRHVNAGGDVCLWDEGEEAYEEWLSLPAIQTRIADWCADQQAGSPDLALDAHLYFIPASSTRLVIFDLEFLVHEGVVQSHDGAHADLRATLAGDVFRMGTTGDIAVAWYRRTAVGAPPANRSAFRQTLTAGQRLHFDRFLARLRRNKPSLAILLWDEATATNALALQFEKVASGGDTVVAIQVARTDPSVMRLRAGPDAPDLVGKRVTIFGLGAIGSEMAITLARCGVEHLTLVDFDLLRPGNLTRHAASGAYVGLPKVEAMRRSIEDALLPGKVEAIQAMLWEPRLLEVLVRASNLTIDATGNPSFADLISRIAESQGRPMLSAALYRAGAIAKVCVQGGTTYPIWRRGPSSGFPTVPTGAGTRTGPQQETGCGAPVNNAPPWSSLAAAALACRMSLDVLTARLADDIDVIEVYQPIEEAPFETRGLLEFHPAILAE